MKPFAKKRWNELFTDRPAKTVDCEVRDLRAFAKYKPDLFAELCGQAATDTGFDEFFAFDGIVIRECGKLEAFVWHGSLATWKKRIIQRLEIPRAIEDTALAKKEIEALTEQYASSDRELRAMMAELRGAF